MSDSGGMKSYRGIGGLGVISLLTALLVSSGSAQLYGGEPAGEERVKGILELVDPGRDYVIVQSRKELRWQMEGKKDKQVQYFIKFTTEPRTISSADQIIAAWWKYQDRSRWTMEVYANGSQLGPTFTSNPEGLYGKACTGMGKQQGDGPFPKSALATDVVKQWTTPGYEKPPFVDWVIWYDKVNLSDWDFGGPHQRTFTDSKSHCPPNYFGDFQDDMLGVPGFKRQVYLAGLAVCLRETGSCWKSKDYPNPQKVDWEEVKRRQKEACPRLTSYYATYNDDIEKARVTASPEDKMGVWWHEVDPDLYEPLPPDKKPHKYFWVAVPDTMDHAKGKATVDGLIAKLEGISGGNAKKYYDNKANPIGEVNVKKTTLQPGDYTKPTNQHDEVGITHFEEFKRWWPTMNKKAAPGGTDSNSMHQYGYAEFYQMWKSPQIITDNKIGMYQFQSRCLEVSLTGYVGPCSKPPPPITINTKLFNYNVDANGVCSVSDVREGKGTFTHQTHYRWVTVPEGYLIPDVKGTPKYGGRP